MIALHFVIWFACLKQLSSYMLHSSHDVVGIIQQWFWLPSLPSHFQYGTDISLLNPAEDDQSCSMLERELYVLACWSLPIWPCIHSRLICHASSNVDLAPS